MPPEATMAASSSCRATCACWKRKGLKSWGGRRELAFPMPPPWSASSRGGAVCTRPTPRTRRSTSCWKSARASTTAWALTLPQVRCLWLGLDQNLVWTVGVAADSFHSFPAGTVFGADDFLPCLTWVLLRSDVVTLQIDTDYMMELLDPTQLQGEGNSPARHWGFIEL